MTDDGFSATIVLTCLDRIRVNQTGPRIAAVGDFIYCPYHSEVVGYDPENGEPKYERDQRIIAVVVDD